jgi:nickel-dependent lactate racemase
MYEIAYGRKKLAFELPPGLAGETIVAHPQTKPPLRSPVPALLDSLKIPLGTRLLSESTTRHGRLCIVIPDSTRPFPVKKLLPPLLDYLCGCGWEDEQLDIAIAYGLHRKLDSREKAAFLGKSVLSRYRVTDHDATDTKNLVYLGKTSGKVPIVLNRVVTEADRVVSMGVVEPHQYAGYSGGAKTIAIGMAGAKTIQATHNVAFLDHPGTGLGRIENNPFSKALREIAAAIPHHFSINVITGEDGKITAVRSGDPEAVHRDLAARARRMTSVPIPAPVDMIIAGVGHPKDVNLYQASRAVTYLALAETQILNPGGVIVIAARAEEGAGKGVGEQNFYRCFKENPQLETMMDRLRKEDFAPGAQRAYMLGKALMKHKVLVVGSVCPGLVRELGMIPVSDISEAFRVGEKLMKTAPARVMMVPCALQTLPTL